MGEAVGSARTALADWYARHCTCADGGTLTHTPHPLSPFPSSPTHHHHHHIHPTTLTPLPSARSPPNAARGGAHLGHLRLRVEHRERDVVQQRPQHLREPARECGQCAAAAGGGARTLLEKPL